MNDAKSKSTRPAATDVPKAVINRLSLYLREMQRLVLEGKDTTSSSELGGLLGCTDAQVRKDLAYFGQFGRPGIGYRCEELIKAIRKILCTDQTWPVALVGAGNLGRALLGYKGFLKQGFHIVAAFDVDPTKVNTEIEDVRIQPLDALGAVVGQMGIRIGMIAVPSPAAQAAADGLVEAGVDGIVNFAPVTISLPDAVSLVGVDLAIELEQIAFSVANQVNSR